MSNEAVNLSPNVIMPNRDFFIGIMFGFNLARKRIEKNPQPLFNGKEAENKDFYLGGWLELTCAKCNRFYKFDSPNDIPDTDLHCTTEGCNNVLILYGITKLNLWRIGNLTFEGL